MSSLVAIASRSPSRSPTRYPDSRRHSFLFVTAPPSMGWFSMEPKIAPFGSWKSPITTDLYASSYVGLDDPFVDGRDVCWNESRPKEAGRNVLVRHMPDGKWAELTPSTLNARTRVHEYGGASYMVSNGTVYFSNFSDQRLYRQEPGAVPVPITPPVDMRYADTVLDASRIRLISVREDHTTGKPQAVTTIVGLDLVKIGPGEILVSGNDFYSNPRLNPDGSRLAWLTWNHPNMPWDGTELWVGEFGPDGLLGRKQLVAGGVEESIFQPEWSPDGALYFVSDRTGWWNLYRWRNGQVEQVCKMEAEFGLPQWVFRETSYAFESADRIICLYEQNGSSHLARLDTRTGRLEPIPVPYTAMWDIHTGPGFAVFLAGSPTTPLSVVMLDLATLKTEVLRWGREETIDPGYVSVPRNIEFPTEHGLTAFGLYYAPRNKDFTAPRGEKPPLLVMSHGGPTSATGTALRYGIQYFTSRGWGVVDVNYGGSTGYGREYRQRLNGNWGIIDVDDCVNAARYLVKQGEVDGRRLAITGGSAGGYTTLCALTFRDAFKAGTSYFGLSDLETFVKDTHKFESRYLDRLVGAYPAKKDLYRQRSPINFVERVSCPIILLQGLEDKVVPPNQSEKFYSAVKAKGLPTAYVPFEGEQHGFRRAENLKKAIEAEFYFYSQIFGFEPADPVEPVHIDNIETYKAAERFVEG